ncbi:MAG: hypothetical protein NC254_03500 [bacterium]|nr:hypothetical protein [bacterium]
MKRTRLQKALATALAVTTVVGMTMTAGATGTAPAASSTESASAAAEQVVAAAGETTAAAVPATSEVTVAGQKIVTTVQGVYAAKTVSGIAVMTPADSIKGAYGLTASQKLYAMVMDTDKTKSYNAMASLNAAAAALSATMGPVLNIDLGFRENGKYTALSADGAEIMMTVAIPKEFQDASANYAVVVVRTGGVITVLPDLDDNVETVTFSTTGGLGCYALVKY